MRNTFTNRKYVNIYIYIYMYATLYTRKQSFWKDVKFGSVVLAFHYISCFNISLSRYMLQNCFVFKKLILRKWQIQTAVLLTYAKCYTILLMSQSRFKVCKTLLRLNKTDLSRWNLIEKGPKYTVSAVPHPQIFFISQLWWPTFLNTLSHLAKNC